MGLFLGASLLTLVEFMQFVISSIVICVRKGKETPNKR